jgi:hypothetical protein
MFSRLHRFIGALRDRQYLVRRNLYKKWKRRSFKRNIRSTVKIERVLLEEARRQYERFYDEMRRPLVSVTIATYNRSDILIQRTIPSILKQTYTNWEAVIVGDHCTDETESRLAAIGDPRLRFLNSPVRGPYPKDRKHLWQVAGAPPMNRAREEARGLWIAHLDDDEVFLEDHIEVLLDAAFASNAELVFSKTREEVAPGRWVEYGAEDDFGEKGIPHSSVLFRTYLKAFRLDVNSWKVNTSSDKHLWTRMKGCEVRTVFLDKVTTTAPLRPGTTKSAYGAEDRNVL